MHVCCCCCRLSWYLTCSALVQGWWGDVCCNMCTFLICVRGMCLQKHSKMIAIFFTGEHNNGGNWCWGLVVVLPNTQFVFTIFCHLGTHGTRYSHRHPVQWATQLVFKLMLWMSMFFTPPPPRGRTHFCWPAPRSFARHRASLYTYCNHALSLSLSLSLSLAFTFILPRLYSFSVPDDEDCGSDSADYLSYFVVLVPHHGALLQRNPGSVRTAAAAAEIITRILWRFCQPRTHVYPRSMFTRHAAHNLFDSNTPKDATTRRVGEN